MAIAIDFPGFNDLKRLVTPIYFSFDGLFFVSIFYAWRKSEENL